MRSLAGVLAGLFVSAGSSRALAEQYLTTTDGTQVWDTAIANWAAVSGGPYEALWGSGDAVFEGPAGTVTVDAVAANTLTFSAPGFVLTNGTITLTGPLIVADSGAAIFSELAGGAGLVKGGTGGTLTLGGTNTYTGGTTVSAGTLAVSRDSQLGAAGEGLALAGGTLRNSGALNTLTRPLTLGAGGGALSLGTYLNYNGAITGGAGLTASGSDFILQPPSPNDIGTLTMVGSRLFVNNAAAIANNASLVITNGARLVFQSGAAPTAPANPLRFFSGCGVGSRAGTAGDLALSTATAVFPSAGSFVFNNDDQPTRGITVSGEWPALTGGLTFQVGGGHATVGTVTLSAAFSGPYGLAKTSPGALVLAASNTFTGGVSVDAGAVRLGHAFGLGATSAALTVKNGATLDLAGFSPHVRGLTDTLGFGATGTGLITNSGAAARLTITRANLAFGGRIAGPVDLVIPTGGSSYQILSGNSTYTGTTTVFGSLETWNTNALGDTGAGTVVTNGAALAMKGNQEPMTFAAEPLTFFGSSQLSLNTDSALRTATWTGPVTLAAGASVTVTRGGANPGTIIVGGAVTGAGALNKDNPLLTLTLAGANDYSGGTTLTAGRLTLGHASALGTGPVAVNAGLLDLNGNSATVGSLSGTLTGAIIDTSAGSGTTTLTVNQTASATCSSPISNGVSKAVALTKTGPAVLTLNGTNTFQGPVTVEAGTLKLGRPAALPVSLVTVTGGGTLDLNALDLNAAGRSVSIAGPGAAGSGGALANSGTSAESTISGVTLAADATVGTTGSKLNVYGVLNGGGNTLTIAGTGEVNLRMNNGLQNLAAVTVNAGLLRLESSQNWPGTYTVNAGGKLDSYGTRTEAGSVVLNGGRLANGGGGTGTWTGPVTLSGTCVVDTASQSLVLSNTVSGAGALTKVGSGQLTLSGPCTFADTLSVSNGTVLVNGSLSHANLSVSAGAALAGSGTLHARVSVGAHDTAVVDGTMTLSGLTLDVDASGMLSGGGPYLLIDATGGALVGPFAAVLDVPAGYRLVYSGKKVLLQASGSLLRLY